MDHPARRHLAALALLALLIPCTPAPSPPESGDWTRAGTILAPSLPWELASVQEPNVLHEGGVWRMWYTGGWVPAALGYAEATGDPTDPANWRKRPTPVLGLGGSGFAGQVAHFSVAKIDGRYFCYFARNERGSGLYVATSLDGLAWDTPGLALAADAVPWQSEWANTHVWREGADWYMLVDGRRGDGPWVTALATSADGLRWSVAGDGPLAGLAAHPRGTYGAPWLLPTPRRDGRYELWYLATPGPGTLPTDLYRATSPDLRRWTRDPRPAVRHAGAAPEVDQVGDPSLVEAEGVGYLFYDALDNPSEASVIRVAVRGY